MSEPTTEAGERLMGALADEHCSIDKLGCHAADEVRAGEFVPLIESQARKAALDEVQAKILVALAIAPLGMVSISDALRWIEEARRE